MDKNQRVPRVLLSGTDVLLAKSSAVPLARTDGSQRRTSSSLPLARSDGRCFQHRCGCSNEQVEWWVYLPIIEKKTNSTLNH